MPDAGTARSGVAHSRSFPGIAALPWIALLALLALCLAYGIRLTAGISAPPDADALRDIGFAQGVLDGNWFDDPVYLGETRHYPPLIPALGAALALLTHNHDLPGLWIAIGPWAGLLPVVAFFLLARRLFTSDVAAILGTACFVLLNGLTEAPWDSGGYTPWLFSPLLTQALFLVTAWLIHARAGRASWADAVAIGAAIGVTFLGHFVPALLLTAMLIAAVSAEHRPGRRMALWLVLAGTAQLLTMAPALLPPILAYPRGIVNTVPGAWVDAPLHADWGSFGELLLLNAPGVVGCIIGWRSRAPMTRCTVAMLTAWVGLCGLFLARHYACAAMSPGAGVCRALQMPPHHFLLYLRIAGALLVGWGAWAVWRRDIVRQEVLAAMAVALLVAGVAGFLTRPYDRFAQKIGLRYLDKVSVDVGIYRWVVANTPPDSLFITDHDGATDGDFDTAAFAVMAAGRKLIATHVVFANPFVDWPGRDAARRAAVGWLAGDGPPLTCAQFANGLWAALEKDVRVLVARATPVFESATHRVYRVSAVACTH